MSTENTVDKVKLISELKEIHSELFQVYKKLFDFKYKHDETFKVFIDNEYKENGVGSKEQKAWNDNFCHRASYTLLNKILFVRICEDKGFMRNAEDYIAGEVKDPHIGEKLSKVGLQKWGALITNYTLGELIKFAFNDMKQSYSNIVLYKEDKYEMLNPRDEELNLKYIVGDKDTKDLVLNFENVLSNIIEKLDTNNFNFKYTDGNILGDVYEKFMDRETRKAIGQFYTPEYVIEYILKNTIEEVDVVEKPFVTVADISCGSGHFLIMTYDILREKFMDSLEILKEKYAEEVYTIKKDGKDIQLTGREYWIKEHVHYHILKNCIYGADIDSFAVQLTTINLLLKDLDNFTDELNIIECDSLIKCEEDYDWRDLENQLKEEFETVKITQINLLGEEEETEAKFHKEHYSLKYRDISNIERTEQINKEKAEEILGLCKFWHGKFDYIVGNPPYGSRKRIDEKTKKYYGKKYFEEGDYDTYMFFIWRAIEACNCKNGFITPNGYFTNIYNNKLRTFILDNTHIDKIINLKSNVFEDANVDTVITIFDNKEDNKEKIFIRAIDDFNNNIFDSKFNDFTVYYNEILKDPNKMIFINSKKGVELEKILFKDSKKLRDIAYCGQGVIVYGTKEESSRGGYLEVTEENGLWKKTLKGRDTGYFNIEWKGLKVKYGNWLRRSRNEDHLKANKILVQRLRNQNLTRRLVCSLDEEGYYILNNLNYIISENENYDLKYLLGLLNSNLLNYYYAMKYTDVNIKEEYIRNLPIKKVNEKSKEISIIVDKINKLSKFNLKQTIINTMMVERLTEELLEKIIKDSSEKSASLSENILLLNKLVYDLYKVEGDIIQDAEEHTLGYLSLERRKLFLEKSELLYGEVCSTLDNLKKDFRKGLADIMSKEEFYQQHIINNRSLEDLAVDYKRELFTLVSYRDEISRVNDKYNWEFVNFTEIYEALNEYIRMKCSVILNGKMSSMNLDEIKSKIEQSDYNYDMTIKIFRKDDQMKQAIGIVKDALNSDTFTWNAYRKAKSQDKIDKSFIKYYDGNKYGLSQWSDEIHKQYFMDAIDEYTANSPNEKKAKDILKLFKELDIEDKEDYVDIIEDKIKRAFS